MPSDEKSFNYEENEKVLSSPPAKKPKLVDGARLPGLFCALLAKSGGNEQGFEVQAGSASG